MLMQKFIFIILLLVLCENSYSQGLTWYKILQYTNGCVLYKAHQTSDSGYIAVGTEEIGIDYKMLIIKFNQYGDSLWSKLYDLNVKVDYRGFWIEETFDKGFIVSGSGDGPNTDAYLVKLDSIGNIKWVKIFSTIDLDQGRCVKELPDKGFILLIRNGIFPNQNIELNRTDSLGNLVWRKSYGKFDTGMEVCYVENSGFIVAGWRFVNDTAKLHLLRTDLNGDTLWTKTYFQFHRTLAYSMDVTIDNGFIIGGTADTSDNLLNKAYIIKTDSIGNIEWQKRYLNGYNETCYAIRKFKDYGYVFCGFSDSLEFINERGVVRIIDLFGNILHENYFTVGGKENRLYSVELTNDNGLILCGNSLTFNNAYGLIIKTDSTGKIYPVGINNSSTTNWDFKLHQNYPNPFNPITKVDFDLFKSGVVKIIIYDLGGKKIATLLDNYRAAGSYSIKFNAGDLSSGIYFYKLNFEGAELVKRMVFLK